MMIMVLLLNVLVHKLGLLVGDVLLMILWHMLLDVNMNGLLHWDFDGVWNVFLNLDWHFLDHWIRCGHMYFHLIGHWLLNMNGHGAIIGHMDGHWHLLDNGHGHWLVHIMRHWLVHIVGHWLLNGHLDWVVDNLFDGVRLVDMHVLLYLVVNDFLDGIRSGHMYFDWHMDLLLNWIGCGHMYLEEL